MNIYLANLINGTYYVRLSANKTMIYENSILLKVNKNTRKIYVVWDITKGFRKFFYNLKDASLFRSSLNKTNNLTLEVNITDNTLVFLDENNNLKKGILNKEKDYCYKILKNHYYVGDTLFVGKYVDKHDIEIKLIIEDFKELDDIRYDIDSLFLEKKIIS